MSLFDFFFPEQAQASHLRKLTEQNRAAARTSRGASSETRSKIESLENDVGYLALILGSILETLDSKGVVTRADVQASFAALDEIDGVKDGKLDINFLRGRHN